MKMPYEPTPEFDEYIDEELEKAGLTRDQVAELEIVSEGESFTIAFILKN